MSPRQRRRNITTLHDLQGTSLAFANDALDAVRMNRAGDAFRVKAWSRGVCVLRMATGNREDAQQAFDVLVSSMEGK